MISKEKFVDYIKFIESLDIKEDRLQKGLEDCFGRENVGYLYPFNIVAPKMIEMLCDLMEIKYNEDPHIGDDIQYFIYELNYGKNSCAKKAIELEDKTWDLSSAEKLYDYILESKAK